MENKTRPVNLALMTIKFPPMAIASILHRLSGVLLFLFIPLLLCLLDVSLRTAQGFADVKTFFVDPWARFFLWVFIASFIYHFLAGIRHLMMDVGWGETLPTGRWSAILVIALSAIAAILMGIRLW